MHNPKYLLPVNQKQSLPYLIIHLILFSIECLDETLFGEWSVFTEDFVHPFVQLLQQLQFMG